MISVIHAEIWSNDWTELNTLTQTYSSCVRFAYNRFKKHGMNFNDARNACKTRYKTLNTRQVSDAVLFGQSINTRFKTQKVIFGGKKAWNDLKNGNITKEQWKTIRDNWIYSRGDKTKSGNPNIRIVGDNLRITVGNRKWINYKLFVPNKFKKKLGEFLKSGQAYNVRLKQKDAKHYSVTIDFNQEDVEPSINFDYGCIGIDTNPDRIAYSVISQDGNLIESNTIVESRMMYGSTQKRTRDFALIANQIIEKAKQEGKAVVAEDLKFKKKFEKWRKKWNRIKSNFGYKKFLELLERKCIKEGIEFRKVNPAYTSVIGKNKYQQMHKLSVHESASYVIGRRGLRCNEKISLHQTSAKLVKTCILGTLAGKYQSKRIHNWVLWKKLKASLPAIRTEEFFSSLSNLKEFDGNVRCGVIPQQNLLPTTDRQE
jgi:IS605 OrfB family transposase